MSSDADFVAGIREQCETHHIRPTQALRLLALYDAAQARATSAEAIANDLYADLQHTSGYQTGVADERARVEALVVARIPAPPLTYSATVALHDLLTAIRCLGKDMQPPAPAALLARLLALTEAVRPFVEYIANFDACATSPPDDAPLIVHWDQAPGPLSPCIRHLRTLRRLLDGPPLPIGGAE